MNQYIIAFTFIILLLPKLVFLYDNKKKNKYQLRGRYDIENDKEKDKYNNQNMILNMNMNKDTIIQESIKDTYNRFSYWLLEHKKQGLHEFHFTIYCQQFDKIEKLKYKVNECKKTGYDLWKEHNPEHIINTYNISLELYNEEVLSKIKHSFPNNKIIKKYKNCCDYYIMYL